MGLIWSVSCSLLTSKRMVVMVAIPDEQQVIRKVF